jgi:hypothetical protein
MFSMITNIYNKKTEGPTLMELLTATGKLIVFFWQIEVFDVCTTGDTAHIDMIFKFLPHMCQHGCIIIIHCWNDPRLHPQRDNVAMVGRTYVCPTIAMWPRWPKVVSLVVKKKNFFSLPVAVNNSIKVGPLIFLL